MNDKSPWIVVARLVRPQGRAGELLADILTDFPERFAERRTLTLFPLNNFETPRRQVTVERHWLHKGRVVFKFAGIDSISQAEELRGLDAAIPREERASLEDGSVYIDDLVGCLVVDSGSGAAHAIGNIVAVDREATNTDLLVVHAPGSTEDILIPFVKAYLRSIDLESQRIEMSLPEGLLTVNASSGDEPTVAAEEAG